MSIKFLNLICGNFPWHIEMPLAIRDKQGQLLTSEKDQEAHWLEHFQEVFYRPAPEEEPDIPEAEKK